jgi:hypothetical protein
LGETLRKEGAPVALVNAWETDFSDDPLTAIMSAIDDGLKPFLGKATVRKAWQAALKSGGPLAISLTKSVAGKLLSKYAGDIAGEAFDATFDVAVEDDDDDPLGVEGGVQDVVDKLADSALNRLMKTFRTQQRSISTFKAQLAKLGQSLEGASKPYRPIYVLIDELDRCRPTYAIRMLEAVKHLFDTDGVVFIVATDTEQLSESVKAVYGADFDSTRYLYRFFDRTYRFRTPTSRDYISYLFKRYNIPTDKLAVPRGLDHENVAFRFFNDFNASLRDMDQCFDMLHTVCTLWDKRVRIDLGYMLSLIILYHGASSADYARLSGRVSGPWEAGSPIRNPSTLIEMRTGTYSESRTVKGTTLDLLEANRRLMSKSLPDLMHEKRSENPITSWVQERTQEEFGVLHQNQWQTGQEPYSVLREYPKYVELAIQFEGEDAAAAD